MNFKVIALSLAMGCAAMTAQAAADKVIGYYPYWSQYSQFYAKDVRYSLVTDIHYMYVTPSEDGSVAFADDYDAENFKNLASMSKDNGVKLIVNVGGFDAEANLKAIAGSDEKLSAFVSNVKNWLATNGGDGVELDWQNVTADDADDYAKLLNALVDGLSGSTVTAVIYPGAPAGMAPYKAEALNRAAYVDVYMPELMNEDSGSLVPNQSANSVQDMLNEVASTGVNKNLLAPVVFLYGKSFTGAKGLGSGHQGAGSGNEGYLPYIELMNRFDTPDYTVTFDDASKSEVAVSETESIVFMGIPSVKAVAQQVKNEGMAGVAVFDLSQDHYEPIVSLLVTVGLELRPGINYKTAAAKK